MYALALLGGAITLLCAYRLPYAQLDVRFAALTLIAVLLGSRITIKIRAPAVKFRSRTLSFS